MNNDKGLSFLFGDLMLLGCMDRLMDEREWEKMFFFQEVLSLVIKL